MLVASSSQFICVHVCCFEEEIGMNGDSFGGCGGGVLLWLYKVMSVSSDGLFIKQLKMFCSSVI